MKKLLIALGILVLLIVPTMAFAAGATSSVTDTLVRDGDHTLLLTFVWIANSSGTVTSDASDEGFEGYVNKVVTDPGPTAPTDDYDITLTDEDGVDVMGGQLDNRDTANSEQAMPKVGSAYGNSWVSGTLTLNISNNSVDGGQGEVKVYIYTDEEARVW